jgi:hypothetical protein
LPKPWIATSSPSKLRPRSGRFPPQAPPELDRLAGHDGRRPAVLLGVLVGDPGHRLRVRTHVRSGDVDLRAHDVLHLGGEDPRQALSLVSAELSGVAVDAALGPTEGDVQDGGLPGHELREGIHLSRVHLGVVANATLHRASGVVVLDPVSDEGRDLARIERQRALHPDLAHRRDQALLEAASQIERFRGSLEVEGGRLFGLHDVISRAGWRAPGGLAVTTRIRRSPTILADSAALGQSLRVSAPAGSP